MKHRSPKARKVTVFTKAFLSLQHANSQVELSGFQVTCNEDGNLQVFDSLDAANDFATAHRLANPSHKLLVTTTQVSSSVPIQSDNEALSGFMVECNVDGNLQVFNSLDAANVFAAAHRAANPSHRLMVTTSQTSPVG